MMLNSMDVKLNKGLHEGSSGRDAGGFFRCLQIRIAEKINISTLSMMRMMLPVCTVKCYRLNMLHINIVVS